MLCCFRVKYNINNPSSTMPPLSYLVLSDDIYVILVNNFCSFFVILQHAVNNNHYPARQAFLQGTDGKHPVSTSQNENTHSVHIYLVCNRVIPVDLRPPHVLYYFVDSQDGRDGSARINADRYSRSLHSPVLIFVFLCFCRFVVKQWLSLGETR